MQTVIIFDSCCFFHWFLYKYQRAGPLHILIMRHALACKQALVILVFFASAMRPASRRLLFPCFMWKTDWSAKIGDACTARQALVPWSLLRPWQTRKHCCGNIVTDANVSPFARTRNICCGRKFCVRDAKNVSEFLQKHFASVTNVSPFARRNICIRNIVSATMFPRLPRPLECRCQRLSKLKECGNVLMEPAPL